MATRRMPRCFRAASSAPDVVTALAPPVDRMVSTSRFSPSMPLTKLPDVQA